MAGPWTNPCGGLRWRNLSDGTIEIEGRGVVLPPAGEGKWSLRTYVRNSWRNFEPEIKRAAQKHGLPANWVVAIIATETGVASSSRERQSGQRGLTPAQGCPAKCCYGAMQIMTCPYPNHRTYGKYPNASDMLDPWKNIDTGAAIMKHFLNKGLDLPAISARYNSGGLCCRVSPAVASKPGGRAQNAFNLCSAKIVNTSYPMMTIMMNNFAVRELGVTPSGGAGWLDIALYAGGGAALVGAVAILAISLRS